MIKIKFEDVKVIFRDLGEVMMYFSSAFLLPIIVSLIYREGSNELIYYLAPAILTFTFGLLLNRVFHTNKDTEKTHAFSMVVIAWFILPLSGAVPYMLYGVPSGSAYFDSVSAFTTTGLTPLREQGAYPASLMFWRSTQAWIGGAGIIVLALVGIFAYIKSYQLYKAEGREERLRPSIKGTVKRIWWIYIVLTSIGVLLLLISGLTPFQSVNYSMSAISTNGMDMAWMQLEEMNNLGAEISIAIIMLLGSFSFYIHYQFLKKKWRSYLGDIQVKLTIILLLLGAMVTLPQFMSMYGSADGVRYSLFHSTSAITAGGFHSVSGFEWTEGIKITLGLLMVVGGSAGSTAGGLKIIRFWIFLKSIYWKIKEYALPERAHFSRKIEGRETSDKQLRTTYLFILLYILFIVLGGLVITLSEPGVSSGDALVATSSSQGNAGLMIGVVEPGMRNVTKAVLVFNMVVGRIEIIPVLHAIGFLLRYKKTPSLKKSRKI